MFRLKNWRIKACHQKKFKETRTFPFQLIGDVYGHHRYDQGTEIQTSMVVGIRGRLVDTVSGSVFELDRPAYTYIKWCKANKWSYNEDNPLPVGVNNDKN